MFLLPMLGRQDTFQVKKLITLHLHWGSQEADLQDPYAVLLWEQSEQSSGKSNGVL